MLHPGGAIPAEQVGRTGRRFIVIISGGAHYGPVSANGDTLAKIIVRVPVTGSDFMLFFPIEAVPMINIGRTGIAPVVIIPVSAGNGSCPADGDAVTEILVALSVRREELLLRIRAGPRDDNRHYAGGSIACLIHRRDGGLRTALREYLRADAHGGLGAVVGSGKAQRGQAGNGLHPIPFQVDQLDEARAGELGREEVVVTAGGGHEDQAVGGFARRGTVEGVDVGKIVRVVRIEPEDGAIFVSEPKGGAVEVTVRAVCQTGVGSLYVFKDFIGVGRGRGIGPDAINDARAKCSSLVGRAVEVAIS